MTEAIHVLVGGLNHRTAPIAVRERLAVPGEREAEALAALGEALGRGVILSTCNRCEFYTLATDPVRGRRDLDGFVEGHFGVSSAELAPYMYYYQQEEAVAHLFRVACSLDSMIVGEAQILGQVRDAFSAADQAGTAGGLLSKLFHHALRVGKRARHETAIGRNALSVSRTCVRLAQRTLGKLAGRSVVVVGVGEAGKLAARALRDAGAGEVVVTNRTLGRAEELARELGGEAQPFDSLPALLARADIVVSCTGSPGFILTFDTVRRAVEARSNPLVLIDIAVPRDIDPRVKELPHLHLYDIDDLDTVSEANRRERAREAEKVEVMVREEAAQFMLWWNAQAVAPTIADLSRWAEGVRRQELAKALRRMPHLAANDRERIEALSRAVVKQLLHRPIVTMKEWRDKDRIRMARDLFRLDGDGRRAPPS